MSGRFLTAAAQILEKVSLGADDAEIDSLIDSLKVVSQEENRTTFFRKFVRQVNMIRHVVSDSTLNERGLTLLIDTMHDLSSTLSLQDLLRTIALRVRNLVGADVAWVTILDNENELFRVVTAEGNLSPATAKMTSRIDHGAVSLIMNSKSYFETQDYLNDRSFRHAPELDSIFRVEKILSLAGFPILWEGNVHGFLFVASRYARKLSGREMSVLGTFALHAGVAMRNANAFALLSEALDEAKRNRSALIEHIQRVEASAEAHDALTNLLASGAELRQFLEKMASQIGGAVFLYDDEFTISEEYISGSYNGGLASQIREGKINPVLLMTANSQSRHTGRSVRMLSIGNEQCRAIALHGGTGRRDSLVICHQGDLDAIDIRNLERSTVALSIAKLWNERRETEKLIASSTLLRHLVLVIPPDPPTISAIRERLNLRPELPVQLALISFSGLDRASQTTRVRECASKINVLVDLFDDTYLAVGPGSALHGFVQNLVNSRNGWEVGGILSDPFGDLSQAANYYTTLNRAIQVLRKLKALNRFVQQCEVNMFAKLFEVGDVARLKRYVLELLRPIDKNSHRQKDELKRTLLCYLDNQYNIKRTAASLGIHINTVRQRLDALRVITGGWDNPIKALELHVALRLSAIME